MKIRKVIITGATGILGKALIKELISRKIEVLVLAREESKRNKEIAKSNLIKIKYFSLENINKCTNKDNETYDVFFHLAWEGTSKEKRNNPKIQQKNIKYTIGAMNCAKRYGCKKFIGIGSQAEYGVVDEVIDSNTKENPITEYGKAKYKTYKTVKEKAAELKIDYNWIRILSLYGPGDRSESLLSYAIKKMQKGDCLNVTLCEHKWDYLYSEDAANALFLIASKGKANKIYVLGSGERKTLKDYLEELKIIIKSNSIINYGAISYSNEQTTNISSDISEIKKDTTWEPKTTFNKGIKYTIKKNITHI